MVWPDPMSASVNHIVPLSQGGSHTLANAQCAYLTCNCSKGDQMIEEIMVIESIITSVIDDA